VRQAAQSAPDALYKVQPSAKAGSKGASYQGAVAVSPGVWLYQLSGNSLALELTAQGTRYYKDEDLN
jgi:hypothetical protein